MARYGVASSREQATPSEGRSTARVWPFVLTVCFGIVFMGLADFAWLTAINTDHPWFSPTTSAQMYTATLTTAMIATLIIASFATSRLSQLERRGRTLDAGDSDVVEPDREPPVQLANQVLVPQGQSQDPDGLDQILAEIGRYATGPTIDVREKPPVRIMPPLAPASPIPTPAEAGPDRRSPRQAVRRARRLVWQTVAGPLIMFLVFIAISGAMLPATAPNGFADTHYKLNTGLILFLGYGWPFLVAWALSAIAVLQIAMRLELSEPPEHAPQARLRRLG